MAQGVERAWPYEPHQGGSIVVPEEFACRLSRKEILELRSERQLAFLPGIVEIEEVEDGCVYWFERTEEWFAKVTEFILFESECCRHLDFGVGLQAGGEQISLRISGPPGHKSLMYDFLAVKL